MKKTFIYILTVLLALTAGNLEAKNVKRETITLDSKIKYIVNNTTAKIIASQGSKDEMNLEVDEDIFDKVKIKQEGNKVYISLESGNYYNIKRFNVFITLKEVKGIKTVGSGDILTTGQIKTNDFTLLIEGSGDARITNIISEKITIAIFGSGDVTAAGTTNEFNCEIQGTGDVNAIKVTAKNANVKISGNGDCAIDAIDSLAMQIFGSGDVYIKNSPLKLTSSIKGQGELKFW